MMVHMLAAVVQKCLLASLRALAGLSGVTAAALSQIENGKNSEDCLELKPAANRQGDHQQPRTARRRAHRPGPGTGCLAVLYRNVRLPVQKYRTLPRLSVCGQIERVRLADRYKGQICTIRRNGNGVAEAGAEI
jgi:hypothetical protein